MLKKVVAIIALVLAAGAVAGCTSSTTNPSPSVSANAIANYHDDNRNNDVNSRGFTLTDGGLTVVYANAHNSANTYADYTLHQWADDDGNGAGHVFCSLHQRAATDRRAGGANNVE